MVQPQQDTTQDTVEVIGLEVIPEIKFNKPVLRFCAVTSGSRHVTFDIEIFISGAKAELDPGIGPTGHEPGYSDGPRWCIEVQPNDASAVLFGQAVVKQNQLELARFQFLRLDLAQRSPTPGSPVPDPEKALGVLIKPLLKLKDDGKPFYVTFCRRIGGPAQVARNWIAPPSGYRLAGEPIAIGTEAPEVAPPMVLLIQIDHGIKDAVPTTLASYEHQGRSTRTGVVCTLDGQKYLALVTDRLWDCRYCLVQPT